MIELIEQNREQINAICRKYGVKKLEVFGSAASGAFDASSSDVDFFYEFERDGERGIADRFFGLWEDLAALLQVKVDLVSAKDAKNPYFLQVANEHRVTLYAA